MSEAIKELLKMFHVIFSNVGFCGLAVRGLIMLEDATGEIGGKDVVFGSVVREESPNLTLVLRFLGAY